MAVKSEAGRIGVWGASGSGKSSYVKWLLSQAGRRRVIVLDHEDEYSAQGFKRVTSVDQVRAAFADNYMGARVALVPRPGREAETLNLLSGWIKRELQAPFAAGRKGAPMVSLVVEEMNISYPNHAGAAKIAPMFLDICSRGRKAGIEVIGVSQRMAEVSTNFRGNCSSTVILRQEDETDIAAAINKLGRNYQAEIRAMRDLEFYEKARGEVKKGLVSYRGKKIELAYT